jgi:hypothetical protein
MLECYSGSPWGVYKECSTNFIPAILPGIRNSARHEYAAAGSTGAEFVANFEAELSAENEHHLITVAMEVEWSFSASGSCLLERHHRSPCSFSNLSAIALSGATFHMSSCLSDVTGFLVSMIFPPAFGKL